MSDTYVQLSFLEQMDEGLNLGRAVKVHLGDDPEIDRPVRVRHINFDHVRVLLGHGLPQRTDTVALDDRTVTNQWTALEKVVHLLS